MSPYTVEDLKSIFKKAEVSGRGELVGQVFLEHYAPRWDHVDRASDGWWAKAIKQVRPAGRDRAGWWRPQLGMIARNAACECVSTTRVRGAA